VALLRPKPRIDRNKRCRQNTFAEEVLQYIRDAERGAESIGGVRVSEIVSEDAIADQPHEAAKQDASRDGS
jgi:hypothetical protein